MPAEAGSAIDLSAPRRVHVIGIGGAGMAAIASVLAGMGHEVSGSDLKESPALERLRAMGVQVRIGHDVSHLDGVEVVTASTAIPSANVEWRGASERGITAVWRAGMLRAITAQRRTVAVAGTHGKTTTSSMLALALRRAELRPSFIIGGDVNEVGSGAAWDVGEWFVVEADESDGTFLELHREVAMVTNLEPDHLEHHGGWDPLRHAFEAFVDGASGPVLLPADDVHGRALGGGDATRRIGEDRTAEYRISDIDESWEGVSFTLATPAHGSLRVELPVPGRYNAHNASMAAAAAIEMGAPVEPVLDALACFGGVARRFEHRGTVNGIVFVDDYAHLPSEVAAVVQAARVHDWGRMVGVFQPHRYSRTESLWADFADAFVGLDEVLVTDVYAAGEPRRAGITGELIVQAVRDAHPDQVVRYVPHRDELVEHLFELLRPGDLCLTLGAGDLTMVPDEVQARLV